MLMLLAPWPAAAQWGVGYDEALDWHFALSVARVGTDLDGDLAFGDTTSSTQLDVAGTLDLASDDDFAGRLAFQPARGHVTQLDFVPIRFAGDTNLDINAVINGFPYSAGDRVRSSIDLRSWGLSYRWGLSLGDYVSIGPVVGVDLLEGDLSTANLSNLGIPEVEERVLLPLPLAGLRLEVRPLPRLHLFAEARGMKLSSVSSIDDVEILAGEAGVRLLLAKHLALTGRYRLDDYDFTASDVDFDLRMAGVFVDMELRF